MTTVLLATPFLSGHWDAGLFWLSALGRAGIPVIPWDYRRDSDPPKALLALGDAILALKTNRALAVIAERYRGGRYVQTAVYWPDALGRDPESEALLQVYDRTYTCLRPTPAGMVWLPSGFDPAVHYPRNVEKRFDTIFIGTATPRKREFLSAIKPDQVWGNGWGQGIEPAYMDDYCTLLSMAKVNVNIHRDGDVGLNRRFFEILACGFGITDIVPGVEEILGPALTERVGFRTPDEGHAKAIEFATHESWRQECWELERKAIAPYTYDAAVRRVMEDFRA